MAGVDPYAPCPCGSGQKFKWCCHKVETFADKSHRLFEGGQVDAAIRALDEGLRKEPGNPWLLTRKSIIQIQLAEFEAAKSTLREILKKRPKHLGALILLTRCILETEPPVNGAGVFQEVYSSVEADDYPKIASLARTVAVILAQDRKFPAAFMHFDLASRLGGEQDATIASGMRQLETSPSVSPWSKDRLRTVPPPDHLDEETRSQFERARLLAEQGHWAPAAAGFDALAGRDPGGEADYNLGLCRLWLGDEAGAVGPLRRRSKRLGASAEAVDLEVLCQQIEPIHPDDRVERIQLTWPLRNREALLAALRSRDDIHDEGPTPIDPDYDESPTTDDFVLLDRPRIERHDGKGLSTDQIPRILGRIVVGPDTVALETYDDGRVDALGDRFTAVAGHAIVPAHPRTKVLDEEGRSSLALYWEWLYPDGLEPEEADRLGREQRLRIIQEVWPATPMPYLGFRTPERAARDGDAAIPLRAALLQFEQDPGLAQAGLDFAALRARLNVQAEPAIDPATVDVEHLASARLASVPAESLDDDRLLTLYRRAHRGAIIEAMKNAALAIVARPSLFERGAVNPVSVYSDLASLVAIDGDKDESRSWLARGRQADPQRGRNAPLWDMVEVRLRARSERPEAWVPELAVILERYAQEPSANQVIMLNLVEMGLVRLSPNPDDPEDFLLDSRPLQSVLAEYGPRVTTASGRLGVSAAKPDLWTPGGPASDQGGGLWTPGSGTSTPPAGDKPKLIIPGR